MTSAAAAASPDPAPVVVADDRGSGGAQQGGTHRQIKPFPAFISLAKPTMACLASILLNDPEYVGDAEYQPRHNKERVKESWVCSWRVQSWFQRH